MTNVAISVYGPDGAIRRSLNIGLADVALNIAADEQVVQGEYDPDTHWVIDGQVHVVPPRPSRDHSWLPALRSWVDLRGDEARAGAAAAVLAARRAATSIDKSALLLNAMERRIITPAEVEALSVGTLPARFDAYLGGIPDELRATILARWRLETSFARNHPVIIVLGVKLGLDDTLLDQIFGIASWP